MPTHATLSGGTLPTSQLGTGTPTGSKFLRDDGSWQTPPGGGGGTWGSITGTLSSQTDLQTALNGKADTGHTHAQLHDPVTVSDTSSINLTLAGQLISADAIFGTTAGTIAQGNHTHAALYQPLATVLTNTTASFTTAQETKLAGIETGATADMTGAEIVSVIDTQLGGTTWQGGSGGASYHLVATLDSDQATGANVTPVTLSGLVFSYAANSKYRIWAMGRVQPTAATTGCGFQFDLSSVVTAIDVQFYHQLANTGTLSGGHSIADDASVGVSSGMPGTSTYPVNVQGLLVTGANSGTAQLRFRSETTAVTTCKAGFTLVVEKIA